MPPKPLTMLFFINITIGRVLYDGDGRNLNRRKNPTGRNLNRNMAIK